MLIINPSISCEGILIQNAVTYPEDFDFESLSVKAPGSEEFESISIDPGNWCSALINKDNLSIACSTCDSPLPDGLYEIKYTLNQEEYLFYYFNTCNIWNEYQRKVCAFFEERCNKQKELLNNLHEIRDTILDLKVIAENCENVDRSFEMYDFAKSKLSSDDCMC